ncbi:hypothetical protein BDV98DRAFT_498161 [Pterulicium gracile]|uniref:LCCL domain-containing protein n=1 Tax=Pterulicium gracile TaxID=1884261 RepID=A0A5C3QZM7_9AGAR|nr:hypothetical protein BDV98DRAFT_498161 [Pterula gracilis]
MTRAGAKLQATFPRLAQAATKTAVFVRGPRPKVDLADPRPLLDVDWTVRGRRYFVPIESMVMRRTQPFTKPWVFAIIVVAYIIGLAFLSKTQSFDTPADSFIGCTSSYWRRNDDCGLDGEGCGGVPDNSTGPETFDYRCPAQCDNVILQNFRTVGNEQVAFVPLVVGGGDAEETYRGDSFICAAAIQAGVISSSKGGCFSLELVANHTNFAPRNENGLASLGFPTIFPLGFRFTGGSSISNCEDIRNQVLAFNVIMSALLFFLFRPHGLAVFWSLVCIGFWHVTLFSQPRSSPPSLSFGFGTFLPTLFICYAFWRLAFRFTLPVFLHKAPLEAAVWYLGPFWVGVLFNLTFDRIPISRLVASDISQRAGGVASLVIMIIVLATCVITQVIVIRKTGWLPHYLKWYIIGGLVLMVLALLPNLQLRIHHYIFAMVFLPGTAFPTRLSAIFQGVLLGMFLNGAAAFGYDSILQTAAELLRDATLGSEIPEFLTTAANFNSTLPLIEQTLRWAPLPDNSTWDGFSLLVDDVERYVGPAMEFSLALFDPLLPHFFRLALTSSGVSGDFTMPATLWPNGTWVDPLEGAT